MKQTKVNVIGLGHMGLRHIEACVANGYDICGVHDITTDAYAGAQSKFGLSDDIFFSDIATMVAQSTPDMAIIATPADTHVSYTMELAQLKVGKILCEKPVGRSLKDAQRMVEAGKTHDVDIAINHLHLFNPLYARIKAMIDQNAIGAVGSVNFISGNIGIAMNGSHFFDIFKILTGEKIMKVAGDIYPDPAPNPRGAQYEDYAGSIRGISDKTNIRFSLEADHRQGEGIHLVIAGSDGTLYIDVLRATIRSTIRQAEHHGAPSTRYGMPVDIETIESEKPDLVAMSAGVQNALMNDETYVTAQDALDIIALIVCADYSSQIGSSYVTPDALPETYNNKEYKWA